MAIEFRSANNQFGQLPALAADLVGLPAAVIVAAGAASSPLAAKNATSTIPIVLAGGIDPVKRGFVASLNRGPGGNVTGLTLLSTELLGKRLELWSHMVPEATTVAYLSGPFKLVDVRGGHRERYSRPRRRSGVSLLWSKFAALSILRRLLRLLPNAERAHSSWVSQTPRRLRSTSTTNTDHAPEGLSGSLRRTATTLRGDTVSLAPPEGDR